MKATDRFSSRVHDYVRYRPSYPLAAIECLKHEAGLQKGTTVADVGSGTGILTRLLLDAGTEVYAVEPNEPMRCAAEAELGSEARFHSVNGTAEATTLPPQSIDVWIAAQAFHWFDAAAARREALRIARAPAHAALLWNERPRDAYGFFAEYEALLREFAPEYEAIAARRADESTMREFLGGRFELRTFEYSQQFDFAGLTGRLMSSSYAPPAGHPLHKHLLKELQQLFDRHERDGIIIFPYRTLLYFNMLG